jgi:hypothetical protein
VPGVQRRLGFADTPGLGNASSLEYTIGDQDVVVSV